MPPQQGQIQCCGCRTTLAYPLGATCVRCPLCRQTTRVNQIQIRCVSCMITLALPATAQLAQCPRCRTVMTMPNARPNLPPGQLHRLQQQNANAAPPPPPRVVVVIENPETVVGGRRVKNTAIGTRIDDGVF